MKLLSTLLTVNQKGAAALLRPQHCGDSARTLVGHIGGTVSIASVKCESLRSALMVLLLLFNLRSGQADTQSFLHH